MPSNIRAVIFDMDGVLIDSEPVYLGMQARNLQTKYPWVTLESMYPPWHVQPGVPPLYGQALPGAFTPEFEKELIAGRRKRAHPLSRDPPPGSPPHAGAAAGHGLAAGVGQLQPHEQHPQVLSECADGVFPRHRQRGAV